VINIELRDAVVALGGTVRGQVQWDPDAKPPESVTVELRFRTEGRGTEDGRVVAGTERTFSGDPTMTAPWLEFEFEVPADAPITYEGNLIRIIWEVEAGLDVPWARDPKASVGLTVLPLGA
jgi:hypothetical protein